MKGVSVAELYVEGQGVSARDGGYRDFRCPGDGVPVGAFDEAGAERGLLRRVAAPPGHPTAHVRRDVRPTVQHRTDG